MDYYLLPSNKSRWVAAAERLAKFGSKSDQQICDQLKELYSAAEEQAAMAGVAKLEQVDADYMDLNIRVDTFVSSFAQTQDLKIGEIPFWKTRQEYPIRVNVGHLAGTPPAVLYATSQAGVQVTPFQYFSEEFLVPNLVNANFDLAKFDEKRVALNRVLHDMLVKLDQYIINMMLFQPLGTDVATAITNYFTQNGGPFNGRNPYVLDPYVQTGSVPTTNIIDTSSEGGLTKVFFMKERTWAYQMEREIKSTYVPIAGAPWEATWNQASIVAYSGTGAINSTQQTDPGRAIPPDKWEDVANLAFRRSGAYMEWFGERLFMKPLNVLPSGYTISSTELPAVLLWNQLEDSVSEEETIKGKRAFNKRYEARSIALAQPDPLLRNFKVQKCM